MTIRRKTVHAVTAGLGGVMVWDAAGERSLLRVIQEVIDRPWK